MTFAGTKFKSFLPAATFMTAADYLLGMSAFVIAGHILGAGALASLNLIQPVFNVILFLAFMVGTGTSVLFATEIGRFRERRAHELFTQGLLTAVGSGLLLTVVLFLSAGPILSAYGATPEITSGARSFLRWYSPCAVLDPIATFLSVLCYADGDRRIYALGALGEIVANVACSIPLAYAFGLEGCAVGSCVGNVVSIAILTCHFFRPGNNLRLVRHFSLGDTGRICWCSFGDAALKLCNAGLAVILNAYVISRFGAERLPVLTVVLAVLGLANVFDCIASAAQPLAGIYIGERNVVRIRSVMSAALKLSVVGGLALTAVLAVAPSLALGLVGLDDPALVPAARSAVRLASVGLVATAVIALFNSYFMFIDRVILAAIVTVVSALVVPVAIFPAFGGLWGENGVWTALGVAPFVSLVALALFLIVRWGRANFPYFLDRSREAALRVFDLELEEGCICKASAEVEDCLRKRGVDASRCARAALLVEETLMVVRDRNAPRRVLAEVTTDFEDGALSLVLRDDGTIFDLTDADAQISSLRSYLVSNLMGELPDRRNLTATGFNRNVFRL